MAPPASITYVTVTGRYVDASGNPMAGDISFTPLADRIIAADDGAFVSSTKVTATLDSDGEFSVSLMVGDDADVTPTGWSYRVAELLRAGGSLISAVSYTVTLTADMESPVALAEVAPDSPPAADTLTYVRSFNGATGVVTVSLPDWLNVKNYGAVGDDTHNDTTAIQAAITALAAGGGTVYLPAGTYKLTDALTLRSNLTLLGAGDGASTIHQAGANKNALTGSALSHITIQGLDFTGTGAGTGSGLSLAKGGNNAVPYLSLRDVTFASFGQDGVAVENPIVSVLDRVSVVENGRYGINLFGQNGGAAGTSCALNACYGNANTTAGIRLFQMVYTALNGCAADGNPIGYLIDSCQSVTLSGCGAEANTTNGLKVTGGYGVTATGLWIYDNPAVGVLITGSASTVSLIGATDNSPHAGATNFIKVDSGCHVSLLNCSNDTANSLATNTTNTVSAGDGSAQINGYAALVGGGEIDADLTCYTAAKGFVLTDRSNANLYRLKVTGGVLAVEVVV